MTNNASVIIPTIQKKVDVLKLLINILLKDEIINEIFVINNKIDTPLELPKNDKIKIYTPDENLYVNISWNLGISKIQNENFVIINDDIITAENFCSEIFNSEIFNSEDTGLIGLNQDSITNLGHNIENTNNIEIPKIPENYTFIPMYYYFRTASWGSVIFGKKKNYYEIPSNIKILYGDNYLLFKNLINGKTNYKITGIPILHLQAISSSSIEFRNICTEDIINSFYCIKFN